MHTVRESQLLLSLFCQLSDEIFIPKTFQSYIFKILNILLVLQVASEQYLIIDKPDRLSNSKVRLRKY